MQSFYIKTRWCTRFARLTHRMRLHGWIFKWAAAAIHIRFVRSHWIFVCTHPVHTVCAPHMHLHLRIISIAIPDNLFNALTLYRDRNDTELKTLFATWKMESGKIKICAACYFLHVGAKCRRQVLPSRNQCRVVVWIWSVALHWSRTTIVGRCNFSAEIIYFSSILCRIYCEPLLLLNCYHYCQWFVLPSDVLRLKYYSLFTNCGNAFYWYCRGHNSIHRNVWISIQE